MSIYKSVEDTYCLLAGTRRGSHKPLGECFEFPDPEQEHTERRTLRAIIGTGIMRLLLALGILKV
jgi:hypothetical protein